MKGQTGIYESLSCDVSLSAPETVGPSDAPRRAVVSADFGQVFAESLSTIEIGRLFSAIRTEVERQADGILEWHHDRKKAATLAGL